MDQEPFAVLTVDIMKSKEHSARNPLTFHPRIQKIIEQLNDGFKLQLLLPFEITVGDEFQGVIAPHWQLLNVIEGVRYAFYSDGIDEPIIVKCAAGIAPGTLDKEKSSRLQEGEAFYRARAAMDSLEKNVGRETAITTTVEQANATIDIILSFLDMIRREWTRPQWEAARFRFQGLSLQQIGERLHIAYQNVHKRLKAARWDHYEAGLLFIQELLKKHP
jgi:hypothetical protein